MREDAQTGGKPFHSVYFGAWFADAIDKAGLPEDCVTHGLRKCAARTLADVGCTTEQIKVACSPSQQPKTGSGSGFFVSTEGHVLTNEHVMLRLF